jgi:predicted dehydrogenase
MKVACIGMGWWSDVLADAIKRSGKLSIVSCFSRSIEKREKFAAKYGCKAARSYEEILNDRSIEGIVNTTPNAAHLETTAAAAQAGKHVFLDKPIANTIADARALTQACRKAKVVLALGYQRRRESQFRLLKEQIGKGATRQTGGARSQLTRAKNKGCA